mmetsp:Transcript_7012/g.17725  ORF Transcript_7012/g.17725 Transcript_7012/m.17725 type:complete len:470 (-) Transcript_7012:1003-2412(-)
MPSCPYMPMPTCAFCSMGTSLAPSPTASVMVSSRLRTMDTTAHFCMGVTRQHTTEMQRLVRRYSSPVASREGRRCSSDTPSITSANAVSSPFSTAAMHSRTALMAASSVKQSCTFTTVMSVVIRLHASLMLMAVSILSPVRTHTFTPACSSDAMASGTPSCSLSSIADTPSTVSPCSTSSASAACASCRPWICSAAASHRANHSWKAPGSSSRYATYSTRRPSTAKSRACCSASCTCGCAGSKRGTTTASAPLHSSSSRPSGVRTTTDIRLRSLVNSSTHSSSCASVSPCTRTCSTPSSRRRNSNPLSAATPTSALSSGEVDEYTRFPPRSSASTVWHSANTRKNMRQRSPCPPVISSAATSRSSRMVSSTKSSWRPYPALPLRFACRPYTVPPMEHSRNTMRFCVSVPVLSEKTCCTMPSSSLRLEVRASMGRSVGAWYMSRSYWKNLAWMTRVNSALMYRDSGTTLS